MQQLDWTLREGGCLEVLEEYRAAGKIRWIDFSTHAHAAVIHAAISSKRFDSMNIHYHVRPNATGGLLVGWLLVAAFCFDSPTLVRHYKEGTSNQEVRIRHEVWRKASDVWVWRY